MAGNTVHLRVPSLARERHGIFVGNSQNVLVRENLVEVTWPGANNWQEDLPTIDGIRIWGVAGPMVQVRENHTVGVTTGIRIKALNAFMGDRAGVAWGLADNAYAGFGTETDLDW